MDPSASRSSVITVPVTSYRRCNTRFTLLFWVSPCHNCKGFYFSIIICTFSIADATLWPQTSVSAAYGITDNRPGSRVLCILWRSAIPARWSNVWRAKEGLFWHNGVFSLIFSSILWFTSMWSLTLKIQHTKMHGNDALRYNHSQNCCSVAELQSIVCVHLYSYIPNWNSLWEKEKKILKN